LVVFFLFALPLVMSPFNQQYPKLIFSFVFISLLLLLWLVELLLDEKTSLNVPITFWLGLLLLEVALISLSNSNNIRVGLESFGLLICFLFLYLLLANLVKDERSALLLLGSIFAAAVLAAGYGLSQYYGYDPLLRSRIRPGVGSFISTMGNKNYLGGFLAYLYMPYGLLLLRAPRAWQKLSILGGMVIIWYAIMAIGSRAVWLGLLLGAIFLVIASPRLKLLRLKLLQQNWGWIASLVILMVAVTTIFLFPNTRSWLWLGFRHHISGHCLSLSQVLPPQARQEELARDHWPHCPDGRHRRDLPPSQSLELEWDSGKPHC
jgi:hypothetical protein